MRDKTHQRRPKGFNAALLCFAACIMVASFSKAMPAHAQAFAGMGAPSDGYTMPQPYPNFTFPQDLGPHPDFRIECWYVTANLAADDGTAYGLQWTLFRSALAPEATPQETSRSWKSSQIWFCHAAVTGRDFHHATERYARGGIGQAGVTAKPFQAWCDDWQMAGDTLNRVTLNAAGPDFSYSLELTADKGLVRHGLGGYSVKSTTGQASYYYSQPHFSAQGTLRLARANGAEPQEIPVSGSAWLDREWSSQPLAENQTGWDWFSLNFDNGAKLMAFSLRQTDEETYRSATWIAPNGESSDLAQPALTLRPMDFTQVADRKIPTQWSIKSTNSGKPLDIVVTALNPRSWMDLSIPYWEGPVRISGSHTGTGYLEMTGY